MKPKIKRTRLRPSDSPELRAFAQLVGEFIGYWGFKPVQGRLWCYLYIAKDPLDSQQLAQLLEISPALVTQSVQVLLNYRVIQIEPKGANGVLRFSANPEVSEVIAGVLKSRELELLNRVALAQKRLKKAKRAPKDPLPSDEKRIDQMGEWLKMSLSWLELGISILGQEISPFEHPGHFTKIIE